MNKTTIATTLVSISFLLCTASAYAQTGVVIDRGAAGDVNSQPKDTGKAKDAGIQGGSGDATISRGAAGDVTSKPKVSAKAKDTSTNTSGYTGSASTNPGAAGDVTSDPKEGNVNKNRKSAKRSASTKCADSAQMNNATDCK
jgi:hypothetical protein